MSLPFDATWTDDRRTAAGGDRRGNSHSIGATAPAALNRIEASFRGLGKIRPT